MVTRHVSVIALFQFLALGGAVLFATTAARLGDRLQETRYVPLPPLLGSAHVFRDYGWWWVLAIAVWAGVALRSTAGPSARWAWLIGVAGIGMVVLFFSFASAYFFAPFLLMR